MFWMPALFLHGKPAPHRECYNLIVAIVVIQVYIDVCVLASESTLACDLDCD